MLKLRNLTVQRRSPPAFLDGTAPGSAIVAEETSGAAPKLRLAEPGNDPGVHYIPVHFMLYHQTQAEVIC